MNVDVSSSAAPVQPLHRLESQLCFALYSALNAMGRAYAPLLETLGLTYSQYIVLLVLWERDNVTVKTIGQRLFLDSGTLTPLLKRLEQAGLIVRRRDMADERLVRIHLTPAGDHLREKARAIPAALRCAVGQDSHELAVLRDDLLRLRTSLMASLDEAVSVAPDARRAGRPVNPPHAGETVDLKGENDAS